MLFITYFKNLERVMRKFFRIILIGAFILGLQSCGKEEGGGGSSSSSNGVSSSGSDYSSYEEVKSAFSSMSLSSGVSTDMVVYHIGSAYGATSTVNNGGSANYCIRFFGYTSGDCSSNSNANTAQLISVLNNGEYMVVDSVASDSVTVSKAVDVNDYGFDFEADTYTRNNDIYQQMLGLDGTSVLKRVVSDATITVYNTSSGASTTLRGNYVEHFYSNGSVNGFVLSNALPVISNPVLITEDYTATGALKYSGNYQVRSISINYHSVYFNVATGSYTTQTIGSRTISL